MVMKSLETTDNGRVSKRRETSWRLFNSNQSRSVLKRRYTSSCSGLIITGDGNINRKFNIVLKQLETAWNVLNNNVLKRPEKSVRYKHNSVVWNGHEASWNDWQWTRLKTSWNVMTHIQIKPIPKRLETTVYVFLFWTNNNMWWKNKP